jgi:hypothetical protein
VKVREPMVQTASSGNGEQVGLWKSTERFNPYWLSTFTAGQPAIVCRHRQKFSFTSYWCLRDSALLG